MEQYTIDCTPEQTCKALELGAPIHSKDYEGGIITINHRWFRINNKCYRCPTAEQMRGWLMEKLKATTFSPRYYHFAEGYGYLIICAECVLERDFTDNVRYLLNSDKEATLAAIDAALDYLIQMKGE